MAYSGPTEISAVNRQGVDATPELRPPRKNPLLLTLDVHEHPELFNILSNSADVLERNNVRATYFIPAGLLRGSPAGRTAVRKLKDRGHSVGCHGLHHSTSEDLGTMSPPAEFRLLKEATSMLEDALGGPVTSFRAPDFRLSRRTLLFLSELGYKADLSVTPQRLPILSSSPWCLGWLFAPRSPYHPSERSPYRRGLLPVKEIPTSCFLIPLAHGTIANLRPAIPARLLALLSTEARLFQRPLVAMLHPESLIGAAELWKPSLAWHDFFPRRNGGFHCRFYFLMERDPRTIHRRIMRFLENLAVAGVQANSVDDYLAAPAGGRVPVICPMDLNLGPELVKSNAEVAIS